MQRNIIIISVLLLIVSGWSWWISEQPDENRAAGDESAPDHTVDYYVRNFSVTTMTPEGQPARRLNADLMQHYLEDDTTKLDNPFLKIYNQGMPGWDVTAESGWISGDGELVLLSGEVEINRPGSENVRELRILTRDLRVQPNQDYAETDELVTITSERNWVRSIGMQAWLREPIRLKLLSQSRGHYVHQ